MMAASPGALRRRDTVRAAEVAAPARGRILVAEVTTQRDAATAGLVRVLDDGAETPAVLPTEDLEPAAQSLDALDERLERDERMDATAVDALADPGLDERRHERGR